MALPTKGVKYWPITEVARQRMNGFTSIYEHECPTCGSPAWHWCQSLDNSGKRFGGYHRARADRPVNSTPLPDMRDKWKEWAQYEGLHPKPRPADLKV